MVLSMLHYFDGHLDEEHSKKQIVLGHEFIPLDLKRAGVLLHGDLVLGLGCS